MLEYVHELPQGECIETSTTFVVVPNESDPLVQLDVEKVQSPKQSGTTVHFVCSGTLVGDIEIWRHLTETMTTKDHMLDCTICAWAGDDTKVGTTWHDLRLWTSLLGLIRNGKLTVLAAKLAGTVVSWSYT